jgi:hypothetical protein
MATVPGPFGVPAGEAAGSSARATAVTAAAVLAGSVLLGLLGGLIWGEFAPRAVLEEIGTGTAQLVNAESRAFVGADLWFSGIAVVAGLLTGVLGYRFALAGRGDGSRALLTTALILGAVAGTFVMLWLGEQIGLSGYAHALASSPDGTRFSASLGLGAKSALVFWPMFTAIVILVAEWGTRPARDHDSGQTQ